MNKENYDLLLAANDGDVFTLNCSHTLLSTMQIQIKKLMPTPTNDGGGWFKRNKKGKKGKKGRKTNRNKKGKRNMKT